ncbi:MAG: tRNA (5-methylaminomethyl-2-thiouridine)(34)-methyltransferase MnmD [Salibacteraceae bacterium]
MEKNTLKTEIITTGDGSHTLRVASLKEHYHSHKGAMNESKHVFLKMGLDHLVPKDFIQLLEVGFGTGLNALLTYFHVEQTPIHYTTLEAHPLQWKLVNKLNYPALIGQPQAAGIFEKLHSAPWNETIKISEHFKLKKFEQRLQDFKTEVLFDVIFYDAFAPHAQPELWQPEIWKQLFSQLNHGGVLVTYCAKGQVRRDMQAAGFEVERLEGPPGKREMLRATKIT